MNIEQASIQILAGLVSNPSIIQPCAQQGFRLENCSEEQLCAWAVRLALTLNNMVPAVLNQTEHNPAPSPHTTDMNPPVS